MDDKNTDNMAQILQTCNEIIEENKDILSTNVDKIFPAMEIALCCHDLARRMGLLEMEEYIDGRCGRKQEEVPLWEYLKPACWIMVQVMVDDESRIWMLSSLFASYSMLVVRLCRDVYICSVWFCWYRQQKAQMICLNSSAHGCRRKNGLRLTAILGRCHDSSRADKTLKKEQSEWFM